MSRILFRGFVCDEDSQHLSSSFPAEQIVPLTAIGITIGRGTADSAVLAHARQAGRILVTSNVSDFAKEMRAATGQCTSASECRCGAGMITVPNGTQQIPFSAVTRSLRLGDKSVSWEDVFVCNLQVAVRRGGTAEVVRRPICRFFLQDHADCEDCQRLGIVAESA